MPASESSAPSFIIKLNGTRIPAEKESQVKEILVIDRVNNPSKFMITVSDPEHSWLDGSDIEIGTEVSISLGYKDNVTEVLVGAITGNIANFDSRGGCSVVISGYNVLHKLNRSRLNLFFSDKAYSDIIKEIMGDAGLSSSLCSIGASKTFFIRKGITDLAFLQDIVDSYDCVLRVEQKKVILEEFNYSKSEDVILEWDKSLIKFNPIINTNKVFTDTAVYGWDKRKDEAVSTEKASGDSGSDGVKLITNKFGAQQEYIHALENIDSSGADKIALGTLKRNARQYMTADGTAQGDPKLKAGCVVKVNGVPDKWAKCFYVITAKHTLIPEHGYTIQFEAESYK